MMSYRTISGSSRDEAEHGAPARPPTLRRVLTWVRPYRRQLIGFIAAVVLDAIVVVIPASLVKDLIDDAIRDHIRGLVRRPCDHAVVLAFADASRSTRAAISLSRGSARGSIYDLRVA